MAFLTEYGLFLAKTLTLLLAIGAVVLMVVSSRQPRARKGELVVTDLSRELEQGRHQLQSALAGKAATNLWEGERKFAVAVRLPSDERTIANLPPEILKLSYDEQMKYRLKQGVPPLGVRQQGKATVERDHGAQRAVRHRHRRRPRPCAGETGGADAGRDPHRLPPRPQPDR